MPKSRNGIHLIAEMAKVSIGTVDRALHGRGGIAPGVVMSSNLHLFREMRQTEVTLTNTIQSARTAL